MNYWARVPWPYGAIAVPALSIVCGNLASNAQSATRVPCARTLKWGIVGALPSEWCGAMVSPLTYAYALCALSRTKSDGPPRRPSPKREAPRRERSQKQWPKIKSDADNSDGPRSVTLLGFRLFNHRGRKLNKTRDHRQIDPSLPVLPPHTTRFQIAPAVQEARARRLVVAWCLPREMKSQELVTLRSMMCPYTHARRPNESSSRGL